MGPGKRDLTQNFKNQPNIQKTQTFPKFFFFFLWFMEKVKKRIEDGLSVEYKDP